MEPLRERPTGGRAALRRRLRTAPPRPERSRRRRRGACARAERGPPVPGRLVRARPHDHARDGARGTSGLPRQLPRMALQAAHRAGERRPHPRAAGTRPCRPGAGPADLHLLLPVRGRADAPAVAPAGRAASPAAADGTGTRGVPGGVGRAARRRAEGSSPRPGTSAASRSSRARTRSRVCPRWGLADDTAYPELFELLNSQRARWGVGIIGWRNLREIYRVLRGPGGTGHGRGLGLPARGCPRPPVRCLDHAARRPGHARGTHRPSSCPSPRIT